MTLEGIVTKSKDASLGSWRSVLKFSGTLVGVKNIGVPPKSQFEKEMLELSFENATILQMREGEDAPELKDGKYTVRVGYAKKGHKPHKNSFYIQHFIDSAEKLCNARNIPEGGLAELINTDIVMEYKDNVEISKHGGGDTGDDPLTSSGWVFALDGAGKQEPIEEAVKREILGKNKAQALRAIVSNFRTNADPQWRQALNDGTIAEKLGVKLVEGVFTS